MRAHALIIGIDKYKNAAWNLSAAVQDATAFAEWVLASGGVAPENLTLLLSPVPKKTPVPAKRATRDAIVDALKTYRKGAAKDADRFWFYYAGHGLAAPGKDTSAAPVMVPADVDDIDDYLDFNAVELESFRSLMQNEPPKEQFYFIDACRDAIPVKDKILAQQVLWDVRNIDADTLATQAILYGATAGQRAKEVYGNGVFTRALLTALKGLGPELVPAPPVPGQKAREQLVFDKLKAFVELAVARWLEELTDVPPEHRKIVPHGLIHRLRGSTPVAEFPADTLPTVKVWAVIEPEKARQNGRIEFMQYAPDRREWVARSANPAPAAAPPPLPDRIPFVAPGGKHWVRVRADGFGEVLAEIHVYEEKAFPFDLQEVVPPAAPIAVTRTRSLRSRRSSMPLDNAVLAPPRLGKLTVTCRDPKARLTILDPNGGEVAHGYREVAADWLQPGPYRVTAELTAAERVEQTVAVRENDVHRIALDVSTPRSTRLEEILRDHDIRLEQGYAKLGADLGDVANIRLGSLIAYAAWAVRWPDRLQALHAAGVDPLKNLKANRSALQVLVGDVAESAKSLADRCRVQIEGDAEPLKLAPLPKLPAVQGSSIRDAGPLRVRVEMEGFAPASFAVALLPGFITALIITREADGDIDVQQHLNPIGVTKKVGLGFLPPQPDDVRLVELAWRALEGRDPLDVRDYDELLNGKRSNPMMAVIAGYRMFRTEHADRYRREALGNMLRLFPKLPDVHVLAGMYEPKLRDRHFRRAMEAGTPVIAEGFWALNEWVGAQAVEQGIPAPPLKESVLPGIAWTAFTERARASRIEDVRMVGTSGRSYVGDAVDPAVIATAAQSVGLLEVVGGVGKSTTFLIAPDAALIPVHVATAFAEENGDGSWTIRRPARIRFDASDPSKDRMVKRVLRTLRPDESRPKGGSLERAMLDECWPVLLELDGAASAPPLAIGAVPVVGDAVAIIGFPFDFQFLAGGFARYFAGASGQKHAMPGTIVRAPGDTWTFDYDSFTANGTSGAPVLNVRDGTVVGMHVVATAPEDGLKRGAGIALTRFETIIPAAAGPASRRAAPAPRPGRRGRRSGPARSG